MVGTNTINDPPQRVAVQTMNTGDWSEVVATPNGAPHLHVLPPAEFILDGGAQSPSHRRCPFVIGVAGGTASGKTTVCDNIIQRLHDQCVVMLSQDSFYRSLTQVGVECWGLLYGPSTS